VALERTSETFRHTVRVWQNLDFHSRHQYAGLVVEDMNYSPRLKFSQFGSSAFRLLGRGVF